MVEFRLSDGSSLPFQDHGVDVVACISVLEHISDGEKILTEIARILKPGGLLILRIDLDLRGDTAIGPTAHKKLTASLLRVFRYVEPEVTVHPRDVLDTSSGPYAFEVLTGLPHCWFRLKQWGKPLIGKPASPLVPYFLAVQGFVMARRETGSSGVPGAA